MVNVNSYQQFGVHIQVGLISKPCSLATRRFQNLQLLPLLGQHPRYVYNLPAINKAFSTSGSDTTRKGPTIAVGWLLPLIIVAGMIHHCTTSIIMSHRCY